jgi:hypothetical protein
MSDLFGNPVAKRRTSSPSGSAARYASLQTRRAALEQEVYHLEAAFAEAHAAQQPFAHRYQDACAALADLLDDRAQGVVVSKAELLAAYDARLAAGHAWQPSRAIANDLGRRLAEARRELQAIIEEIGR